MRISTVKSTIRHTLTVAVLGLVGSLWVDQAAAELIEYEGTYYEIRTESIDNLGSSTTSSTFVDFGGQTEPSWWGDSKFDISFASALAANSGDESIAFISFINDAATGDYSYAFGTNAVFGDIAETPTVTQFAVEIAAPRPVPEIDGAALSSGLLALFALALGGLGFQRNRDSHPAKP
ncbi:hypothetical protein V6X63_10110 [Spiribacter sp. 221]|uniref:hypothetical protein n=1 Tax=Spiribacter onubensis TaxID=3122420 RepID=UPI00349F6846